MSRYSLADLSDLADVTPRTIRYYIVQGLIRPPEGAGPRARYDDGHLYRLRLIRQLQRDHLPLGEIRSRLAAIGDDEVAELVTEEPAVRDSASEYIAAVLHDRGVTRHRGVRPPAPAVPLAARLAAPAPVGLASAAPVGPASPSPHRAAPVGLASAAPVGLASAGKPSVPVARSQWERVALTDDIELHIRRPLGRDQNRAVERIVAFARELLKEDIP